MTETTITPSHTIRPTRPDEIVAVADTLAAAFQDDPLFTWCIPEPARRRDMLPGFFRLVAGAVLPLGEATVVADGQAVAMWVPPGKPAVAEGAADAFAAAVADLVGPGAERTFALMALFDEIHPAGPHRFLWFVGTRPAAQGQGRGAALLRAMLARSDAEGTATYLDATSEQNRRLYERHGFEVVGRHTVAGSPPTWAMWRSPRPLG